MHQQPVDLGRTIIDELALIILSVMSVGILAYDTGNGIGSHDRSTLKWIDGAIALIFLGEFLYRCQKSNNRRLFMRAHWWELLCCIPVMVLPEAPLLRLLRLLGLIRLIRVVTRAKDVLGATKRFADRIDLLHLLSAAVCVVLAGALGFHYFEYGANPNVDNLWDSVWWTIVTGSTVGYGDIYPVTTGGRIVAIIVMVLGIGLLAAVFGRIVGFFTQQRPVDPTN